jgi:hypothetical protein
MQAKRYQIFVSSTYSDLIDERREVIESIIDLGHIPAGMEGFPAIDIEQFRYITKVIDQCDYYVVILAARYGSLADDGISFTEKEYRYAVETGKVVIAFVMEPVSASKLPVEKVDTDPIAIARLENFKSDVMKGRLVRLWSDQNSLSKSVLKSLIVAFDEFPGVGWVRASVAASEDVLAQINELRIRHEKLEKENKLLKEQFTPKFDDLAPLDAKYDVQYSYWNSDQRARLATSVTMSWREIFLAVAPHLNLARAPTLFADLLEKHLKAANLVRGREPSVNPISANQIMIQLTAHGLIRRFRAKNTKGAMGEWIQITDVGARLMLEDMVIKAN